MSTRDSSTVVFPPESEDLGSTAILLKEKGVALDATIVGQAPKEAERLLQQIALPRLDLGDGRELTLGELIGEGGMGNVTSAIQRSLHRDVAVKTLHEDLAKDAAAAWLLVDEARITGSLEHPNIVPIHALGVDGEGQPVMVMKKLSGTVWLDMMHQATSRGMTVPIGARDHLDWNLETLIQVCNAVHFAHTRGYVHRDIKPENVMVGEHGEVYLLDWGAALAIEDAPDSQAIVGTLAYMAPEMLGRSEHPINEKTDIYLLGATLHEVLTGSAPHAAEEIQGALLSICKSHIPDFPAWVPAELGDLCRSAMSRNPAERPTSALAFKRAIQDYITHRGSNEMTVAATRRLAQLEQACGVADTDVMTTEDDGADTNRLFIECAFGFRQALEAWPGNAEAKAGLREAYLHMTRFEIARRNPKAAQSLLAQTDDPPADLREAVDDLRREARGRGEELERLRSIAKQLDPTDASGARVTNALVTGICLALLFGWLSLRFPKAEGLDHRTITMVVLAIMVMLGGATLAARDRVLANSINRYLTATMFSIVLTVIGIHVAGELMGAPLSYAFITDFFISGAVTATVGYNIHRGMVLVGMVYFIGALVAATAPDLVLEIMAATFLVAHLVLAGTWRALARESKSRATP